MKELAYKCDICFTYTDTNDLWGLTRRYDEHPSDSRGKLHLCSCDDSTVHYCRHCLSELYTEVDRLYVIIGGPK